MNEKESLKLCLSVIYDAGSNIYERALAIDQIRRVISRWVDEFETKEFIKDDPIQFVHRYSTKQDIEIAGIIAQMFAFGSRTQFLPILDNIFTNIMGNDPYGFIMSNDIFKYNSEETLYRMLTYKDFFILCSSLQSLYNAYRDMEEAILENVEHPMDFLMKYFGGINRQMPGLNTKSTCKKYNMFLRWMVRKNSEVDLGIWDCILPSELYVPVDTHVFNIAKEMGIINSKSSNPTINDMMTITSFGEMVFPDDPARLDFALYGYSINS